MFLRNCSKDWESAIHTWLGPRAFRFISKRYDVAQSPWTAIVMSHRNRHPELSAYWRLAVERSLQHCRSSHSFLLASNSTPLGSFLIQAAKRVQVPVVQLRFPLPRESLAEWKQRILVESHSTSRAETFETQLWVSPIDASLVMNEAFETNELAPDTSTEFDTYPLVDRALIALADKVRVISVVAGSRTEWLIRKRLDDDRFPTASVFVAMDSKSDLRAKVPFKKSNIKHLSPNLPIHSLEDLLDRGAVGWLHSQRNDESEKEDCSLTQNREQNETSSADSAPPATFAPWFSFAIQTRAWSDAWPYLSHCTRARVGAWPDQSQAGYYDSLIAAKHIVDLNATAFDTLKRILLQQRLIASSDLNRSGQPTVSLTEVPLQTLLPRRQFQSHLGRWDWESYGICIHRRWVEQNGGRRVLYSNAANWSQLASQDRPFFQPTRDAKNPDCYEWEHEREWRFLGDIHLADIPFESAIVFVPTIREATHLASICRFPIMVV